ncbi:MAG: cellulase family glycosylhydrolase [Paludibacteraceae bacterium]|nr:cellulase family glycosylhydrolase [Paludibacteraceae bacterium]
MRCKLPIILCAMMALVACSHHPDANQMLLERLTTLQQQGTMFGHQDDPFYGIGWAYEDGRSDVLETCGDYPAVMGFDLGGIEMGDAKNLDSVPFDLIRKEIIRHHRRGGIVTISWHPRNPVTGGTAWDATDGVVTAILADGETHDLFMTWLERVGTFLGSLRTENGEPIPFIFRPWHENNGSWFWWGNTHCTPDEYRALWNLTQDYLKLGLCPSNRQSSNRQIVWSYSPNLQGGFTDETFIPRYPGDDRVDMLGLDAYQWGSEEDYLMQAGADLDYLCNYGAQHHKLVALTECGRQSMPDPTWWHRVLLPLIKDRGLSYALVWRNADAKEHFGPVPNTENGREFMLLYNDPHVLFLNDIAPSPFVRQQGGRFLLNGKPYTFIGTNMWYGAILGSVGQGGNRQRLIAELDSLHALGLDNLRILVGSDGERGVLTKVEPTLQTAPGVYNDTILDGLDFLLAEIGKRQMKAVLYLNNSWEWSGGYGFYLEHAGYGPAPRPEEAGYEAFMRHVAQFADSPEAQQLFYDYVRFIVSRTNRYTHLLYTDDPAVMAWQIGNEPRAFGEAQKDGFARWLSHTSALIRSLDPNHLISVGSEGIWGCEMDSALYHRISADPNIDYLTIHIWPYNWGWAHAERLTDDLPSAVRNTAAYLKPHIAIAQNLRKPIVIEEFGFPRDNMSIVPGTPTTARDDYYRYIFSLVQNQPEIAGCNFWAWGGTAQPAHHQWQAGDDYTGDPAQEPQGLNSVFLSDTTTIQLIHQCAKSLQSSSVAL